MRANGRKGPELVRGADFLQILAQAFEDPTSGVGVGARRLVGDLAADPESELMCRSFVDSWPGVRREAMPALFSFVPCSTGRERQPAARYHPALH